MGGLPLLPLFKPGQHVLVALSGGADSMALLHALREQSAVLGISLTAAHFNHGLRKSAGRDQRCAAAAAAGLGVPFLTADRRRSVPSRGSLEDFLRRERYAFLGKALARIGGDVCATAHTLDDQAETVLFRVLRGTGLNGLQGVLPRGTVHGVPVVRPFLAITRREIEAYLRFRQVRWVEDPSNRSEAFTRNRLRHDLLPYIEQRFAPQVKQALARLAATAAEDYALIETAAAAFLARRFRIRGRRSTLDIGPFLAQPPALRRAVLRGMLSRIPGANTGVTLAHMDALATFAADAARGAAYALPGGVVCRKITNLLLEITGPRG